MAIQYNENIKIAAPNPLDKRYLSTRTSGGAQLPYSGTSEVLLIIIPSERYEGLTVLVESGLTNIEFWFKDGVADINLIEKKSGSEVPIGEYVTGATNLGYFSGQTGIQTLDLSGSGFGSNVGNYYSEYNWYYVDAGGIIRIGSPTHDGPNRRAYVNALRDKSWIYNVGTNAWEISLNDVVDNVGNSFIINTHTDYVFTGVTWSGSTGVAAANVTATGSLTTGDTITIGNPIFKNKTNQDLHLRTIKSQTPEFIKATFDDNYIYLSATTSVVSGGNLSTIGAKVFASKTGSTLNFRTLVASGDTSITERTDGSIVIYSSSDGSADAITGATNLGTGTGIYSGSTNRNLNLLSLVGSGNTVVTKVGNEIVINSSGSGVFTEDITVSIASGKTFGKYVNLDVIPALGKTAAQVIQMSLNEPLEPTLILTTDPLFSDVEFGLTNKSVFVYFSYVINSLNATVASVSLEWRRGGVGAWSGLTTTTTTPDNYFHTIDDSANRFNVDVINYRYTVVDSAGGTGQTTYDVIPQAYIIPTISPTYVAQTLETYETSALREVGNINTTIAGTITSNRSHVNLLEYRVYRDDGSGYIMISTATSINALSKIIASHLDSTSTPSATIIRYKVEIDDEWQTTTSVIYTINLRYSSYFGYSPLTVLSSGQIVALHSEVLSTSRVRTIDPVTAPASNYTYISYPASFGDLTNVIMDGAAPVLGAFTKLTNVSVANFYGEVVSNIIYKSNAVAAFTNNELAFS